MKKQFFLLGIFSLCFLNQIHAQYLDWVRYFGKAYSYSLAADTLNNVYACGTFVGTVNFNPSGGGMLKTASGNSDIYITKMDNNGNLLWVRSMGATGASASALAITIDKHGNIVIAGTFTDSVNFNPGSGSYVLHAPTAYSLGNIFVEKLDPNGNFIWAKTYDAHSQYFGPIVTTDRNDNVFLTGKCDTIADFNPGGSGGIVTGGSGSFLLKLNPAGNFEWVDTVSNCSALALTTDLQSNLYVTGVFGDSSDFDPGTGTNKLYAANGSLFVQKLDTAGHLIWAENMGSNATTGVAIDVDNSGYVLLTGYYYNPGDFDPGPAVMVFDSQGMFMLKLDPLGNLIWGTHTAGIIGLDLYEPNILTHDASNNIYRGVLFDYIPYVDKTDSNGNSKWFRKFNAHDAELFGICTDRLGNIFFSGYFTSTANFNPNSDTVYYGIGTDMNAYVEKLDTNCPPMPIIQTGDQLSITNLPWINPASPSMYYWVNCITGDTLSYGPTTIYYNVTVPGTYGLILVNDYCTTFSNCITIAVTQTPTVNNQAEVHIYPNPATDEIIVECPGTIPGKVELSDMAGRIIGVPTYTVGAKTILDCSRIAPGNYLVKASNSTGAPIVGKVVVDR